MRILLVQKLAYIPSLSGAGKGNRLLLEGLAERNHSCRSVALASNSKGPEARVQFLQELAIRGIPLISSSPMVDVFRHRGVEVHAVYDNQQLCVQLADQIHQFDPAWTLVSEDRAYLCLAVALEASPSRVVCISHSQATLPFGPECFLADPTKTELLRQAAGIITVCNYVRSYIHRWGGLESAVIPFPLRAGDEPIPPHSGSFDGGFVTMINPSPIKGISIFLELARRLPNVQFAAVPAWATRSVDRAALNQLSNIRLVKPSENIDEIYAQTRVLVVPSLWGEAFGKVVVEAMLRGIPVLASNVGGLPEAKLGIDYVLRVRPIERYEEGLDEQLLPVPVVPDQDIGPWHAALGELLSDREHYNQLSAASREAALRYASGLGITPFEDYLEGLARNAPASASCGAPSQMKEPDPELDSSSQLLEALSPERLELLAALLRESTEKGF